MRTPALLALTATAGFGFGAIAVDGDPPAVVVESLHARTVIPPPSDEEPRAAGDRSLELTMRVRVPRSVTAEVSIETRASCALAGGSRDDGQRVGDLERAVRERSLSLTLFAHQPLSGEPERCELSARLLRPEAAPIRLGDWCYREGSAAPGRCDRARLDRVAAAD